MVQFFGLRISLKKPEITAVFFPTILGLQFFPIFFLVICPFLFFLNLFLRAVFVCVRACRAPTARSARHCVFCPAQKQQSKYVHAGQSATR